MLRPLFTLLWALGPIRLVGVVLVAFTSATYLRLTYDAVARSQRYDAWARAAQKPAKAEFWRDAADDRRKGASRYLPLACGNAAFAVWIAWPLRSRWRALRRSQLSGQGLCAACGYDLRASHGRCPECGTVPAPGIP